MRPVLVRFLINSVVWSVNILMCYFLFISFYKILITTSSMFSWFFLPILHINKQFLLEYCSWQSKAQSLLSRLTFKPSTVRFSSAISCSFFLLFTPNFSDFLSINFMTAFTLFSCWMPLIWPSFIMVESRCILLTFLSKFFKQSYNNDMHLGESITSEQRSTSSWFSDN